MSEYTGRRSRGIVRGRAAQVIDEQVDSLPAFVLAKRVLVIALVLASLVMIWLLRDLMLILFGAIVLAVGLRSTVSYLAERLGVRRRRALVVIVGALVLVVVGLFWFVGPDIAANLGVVADQWPQSLERVLEWLNSRPWGERLLRGFGTEPGVSQIPQLLDFTRVTLTVVASVGVMVVAAAYLAISPEDYRRLLLDWVPKTRRLAAWQILRAVELALQRWLVGQAGTVAFTALGMAGALWTLQVPLGGTVALVSALLTVVPFLGAVAGGALVTIMAFTNGVPTAAYAAASWMVIHAVAEYGLLPQLQRWSVNVPPVASILMAVAWGSVFGIFGLLLSGPLTVTVVAAGRVLKGADT